METATETTKYILVETAARRLSVDVSTVYRWIKAKRLGSFKVSIRKTTVCEICVELLSTFGNGAQAQCDCKQAQRGAA